MIISQERAGGSSSFGDTLYVMWPGIEIGGVSASTKEIMEHLIQNDK